MRLFADREIDRLTDSVGERERERESIFASRPLVLTVYTADIYADQPPLTPPYAYIHTHSLPYLSILAVSYANSNQQVHNSDGDNSSGESTTKAHISLFIVWVLP